MKLKKEYLTAMIFLIGASVLIISSLAVVQGRFSEKRFLQQDRADAELQELREQLRQCNASMDEARSLLAISDKSNGFQSGEGQVELVAEKLSLAEQIESDA